MSNIAEVNRDNPVVVKVCDVIMGAGKTESAITQMMEDTESRYIFITPYLDEVERIKKCCMDRSFVDPKNSGDGKLEGLHQLLGAQRNIASTHALFRAYNDETLRLIREGGYKLILDEVFETVSIVNITKQDLEILFEEKMIEVSEKGLVTWIKDEYEGKFTDLREMCSNGHLILYEGCLMLWSYPIETFDAFRDVIILTYMFDSQVQKYYFDMHGFQIQKIGTKCENGVYRFSDIQSVPDYVTGLKDKVHILEDKRLNSIGDARGSLSSSWYKRVRKERGKPLIKQLQNNITNVFINRFRSGSDRNLWTTFKEYENLLKGKGYTKGFLSYNIRATNAYRDRDCLAFCVNVYYNPLLKNYFVENGVEVREDEYALSEMIQWIWRSAIRDGKEIWIYIPSKRMRELLKWWLDELSHTKADH